MPDTTRIVETIFKVLDQATRPLIAIQGAANRVGNTFNAATSALGQYDTKASLVPKALIAMQSAVTRVGGSFDKASATLGKYGSIAAVAGGAFSAVSAVKDTMTLLGNVKKIKEYTGMSSEAAGGFLDAMERAGIESHDAVRSIAMMSRAGARMEMIMSGTGKHTSGVVDRFRQLGVDITRGPQQSLMRMAELAQRNKITSYDLMILYRMMPDTARKFMNMLKEGPGHIKKTMDEYAKLGITTEANVERFARIQKLHRQIKSIWGEIVGVVAVKLLPLIEDHLTDIRDNMESWISSAANFGKVLATFLKEHLGLVKSIGKVMLANFALMQLTGTGMGGWAGKLSAKAFDKDKGLFAGLMKMVGAAAVPAMAKGPVGAVAGVAAGAVKAIPDWMETTAQTAAKIPGAFNAPVKSAKGIGLVFAQIGSVFAKLRPLIFGLARLTIIGGGLLIIANLLGRWIKLYAENINGFRDRVRFMFEEFQAHFDNLSASINLTFGSDSTMIKAFDMIGSIVNTIVQVIQAAFLMIQDFAAHPTKLLAFLTPLTGVPMILQTYSDNLIVAQKRHDQALEAIQNKRRLADVEAARVERQEVRQAKINKLTEEREAPPNFNFPNARFDITQRFAEGFDPDRIAIAFANDLATLGERRLQSGLTPLFAVR